MPATKTKTKSKAKTAKPVSVDLSLPLGGAPSKQAGATDDRPILMNAGITELTNPLTDETELYVVTTDSFGLAAVPLFGSIKPLRIKKDRTLSIAHDALKAWERSPDGKLTLIKTSGVIEAKVGGTTFNEPTGAYPRIDQIVPAEVEGEVAEQIGINPWLLLRCAEALGAKRPTKRTGGQAGVRLVWREANRPLVVQPLAGELAGTNAFGLVMPIRLDV